MDRIALLERRAERLEKAFDTNTAVFADSIKTLEMKLLVHDLILQDALHSAIRMKEAPVARDMSGPPNKLVITTKSVVDFESYWQEVVAGVAAAETAKQEPSPIISPAEAEDAPRIFGGDVGGGG